MYMLNIILRLMYRNVTNVNHSISNLKLFYKIVLLGKLNVFD
jgi:hypothetical protein